MTLPSLLLQKPSAKSKAKEHSLHLLRRLEMWKKGHLSLLINETKAIQKRLVSSKKPRSKEETLRIFA